MSFVHTRFQIPSQLASGERVSEEQHAEEMKILAFQRSVTGSSRRRFLSTLAATGTAAGALALTGSLTGCEDGGTSPVPTPTTGTTTPGVLDVLNFALNLEYLEASFYLFVTTGSGLSTTDMGSSPGAVTGGAKVTFSNSTVASIATQLATDEQEHVELLRSAISANGGTPVSMPALNLAALGAVTTDASFLTIARQFETVGVSAYAGSAQYLVSNTAVLTNAAQIEHVESQHESFLRQLCITLGVTSPAVDGQDIPPTASAVFNTNPTNGLTAIRTTSQVLQIVYGAAGQTGISKGGFFPNGLNGTIVTS